VLILSSRYEISSFSFVTLSYNSAISSLSVSADGPLGVAVALVVGIGQGEVAFDGKGTVENVIGKGHAELQPVGRRWSVQFKLVVLEQEVGIIDDVGVGLVPVVLPGELELLMDEDEGGDEEKDEVVAVEAAEVFVGPAAVAFVGEEVKVLFGKGADQLVGKELQMLAGKVLEPFIGTELERLVGIAEPLVVAVVAFQDKDEVSTGSPEDEFINVEDNDGISVPDEMIEDAAVGAKGVRLPVPPGPAVLAPAEVELMKRGEQHEEEKGMPPLGMTATTTLVEIAIDVGTPVLPGPSRNELDVKVNLLEGD
jgi:hypothetical protein